MEAIVIADDAAMNMDAGQLNVIGLDDAHRMKRAVLQKNVANGQIIAAMEQKMVGALAAADASPGSTGLGSAWPQARAAYRPSRDVLFWIRANTTG